jgi:hypothetical protein
MPTLLERRRYGFGTATLYSPEVIDQDLLNTRAWLMPAN